MLDEAAKHVREAIMLGRTDIIKKLLEEVKSSLLKEDKDRGLAHYCHFLNASDSKIGSFLHEAVKHGKKDVVRALLQEGSDPGVLDESQDTAVDLIASPEMRQVFADVLMQSAASGNLEQMERLLRAGIDVSVIDTPTTKNTPLHWAASFGSATTAQVLLEQFGADPNLANSVGMTSLHDAVTRGDQSMVKVLVKFGANPTLTRHRDGKTALDLAEEKTDILALLKSSSYLHSNETRVPNGDIGSEKRTSVVHNCQQSPPLPKKSTNGAAAAAVISDERLSLLCPQPRYMHQLSDEINYFPDRMTVSVLPGIFSIHDVLDVWDVFRGYLARLNRRIHLSETQPRSRADAIIQCSINPHLFSAQSSCYKLTIANHRIKIAASDLAGLRYCISTLIQIFALFYPLPEESAEDILDNDGDDGPLANEERGVASVYISDSPEFAMRAVLLDLNPYGRVPKMEMLLGVIDIWCLLKINQFHAFFRVGTSDASFLSYSKRDYMTIDRYTRERGIDFVPAIDVDSSVSTSADMEKLRPKFLEIMRCFDRPSFIHLGPKITSILAADNANVFDFIHVPNEDTTFILCANSLHVKTLDFSNLPANSIIAHYGFQKNEAYANSLSKFVQMGLPIAVCSGTMAWSNLSGNPEVAYDNCVAATRCMSSLAGIGTINAHWSSHPSMTHLTFAWPAFVLSACLGWNSNSCLNEAKFKEALPKLLDMHVFGICGYSKDGSFGSDSGSPGRALLEIGQAEALMDKKHLGDHAVVSRASSDSILLRILANPDDVSFDKLALDDFGIAVQRVKRAQNILLKCRLSKGSIRAQSLTQELFLASELLILAARIGRSLFANGTNAKSDVINVGVANLPPTFRSDIANKALTLVEQYRALWLSRYEPQGMQSSLLVLSNLLAKFIPDGAEM